MATMRRMSSTASPPTVATLELYVGGRWVPARAGETLEDRDPATGELLARVPLGGEEDVDAAVSAARAAAAGWAATPVLQRTRAVMKLHALLDANREELARLVTRDMGKTLDDARGEVGRGSSRSRRRSPRPR